MCGWLPGTRGQVAAVAFAGWCSTVLASISCAGQLAWSGTVAWPAGFTAMAGVHMVIGIGEGLISALVLLAIQRMRPDLTSEVSGPTPPRPWGELVRYGLLVALGVAIFVAPFACPWPDGLESVAAKLGFEHRAAQPVGAGAGARLPGARSALGGGGDGAGRGGGHGGRLRAGAAAGAVAGARSRRGRSSYQAMIDDWIGHHHSRRDSPVSRLPAALKLGVALAIIVGTVLAPPRAVGWFVGDGVGAGWLRWC